MVLKWKKHCLSLRLHPTGHSGSRRIGKALHLRERKTHNANSNLLLGWLCLKLRNGQRLFYRGLNLIYWILIWPAQDKGHWMLQALLINKIIYPTPAMGWWIFALRHSPSQEKVFGSLQSCETRNRNSCPVCVCTIQHGGFIDSNGNGRSSTLSIMLHCV